MMESIWERIVSRDRPPFVIAEACNNFNNDFALAREMIHAARDAKADAIKFQLRYRPDRLTPDQHSELQKECEKVRIQYLCTAFDKQGLDHLDDMAVPLFKIGSAQASIRSFVEHVESKQKPILISTGGMTQYQIRELHQSIRVPHVVLHSVSLYPTPHSCCNLRSLDFYGNTLWGLSCHTPAIWTAMAAVTMGARVIEKHFTLRPHDPGPDQSSSITYDKLKQLVEGVQAIHLAMGIDQKVVYQEELDKLEACR